MKPDLVDTYMFEYDIKQLRLHSNSLILNSVLLVILTLCIWLIFSIFKSPIPKTLRRKKILSQLRNILITSDKHLRYKNVSD